METIAYQVENGIGIVTFNRPKALNALNSTMFKELSELMDHVEKDSEVKVVVFTGAGEKAFIAGADIKEMSDKDSLAAFEFALLAKEAVNKIDNLNRPTIAAIRGYALGGGCEVALACDIRIASEKAILGLPEITLGIIPGSGGTQRLSRLVGTGKAKEMIFTGELIDAKTALGIGMINKVVPADMLMPEAMSIGQRIASKGGIALKMAKMAINKGINMGLEEGLLHEIQCFSLCFSTHDQKEGMKAFIEKREPCFQGK